MQIHFDLEGSLCLVFLKADVYHLPTIIFIATIVSLLAVVVAAFTFTTIIVKRIRNQREQKHVAEAENQIVHELNEHILNYDSISDIPENELDQTLNNLIILKDKNEVFKHSLVKIMVYFKHNLTGNISTLISFTYKRLNLLEVSLGKLNSNLWFTKAQGLKELQDINDKDSANYVTALLHNKNIDVRIEAYAALQKLKAENSFSFFKTETEQLSNWHQILLVDAIVKSENDQLPEFKNFLKNENQSLVLLAIKLIAHYKQFEAIPELIELLGSKNEILRHEAICALGTLDALEAERKLISIYPTERNRNKIQILLAIGDIASGTALNFLKEKFLKADHFTILKAAASAIMAHPVEMRDQMLSKLSELDEEQQAIIKHFKDPLIKLHGIY